MNYGEYSITGKAASLNDDLRNPDRGDHTSGDGNYLVANSNGRSGNKIWCSKAFALPNSVYHFSVYFCNLYKLKPSNGIMISGYQAGGVPEGNDPEIRITVNNKQTGETDKDKFQMFRWLHTTAEWYSGIDSGYVEICIENVNARAEGNDLALDDIEFHYVKTMPPGYKPLINPTILNEEYRENMADKNKSDYRRIIALSDLTKGDSLAPGIYTLYPSKKILDEKLSEDQKITLPSLIFEKGDSELLPDAKAELEKLSIWMKHNSDIRIRLEGHSDNIGNADTNIKLSEERVENAKEYLISLGIESTRIETIGYGGTYPVADNSHEETRKLNRRIEFVILEQ